MLLGASWMGKVSHDDKTHHGDDNINIVLSVQEKTENEKLLLLAERLGMNSVTKKKIFVVMMSSRDVDGKLLQ